MTKKHIYKITQYKVIQLIHFDKTENFFQRITKTFMDK